MPFCIQLLTRKLFCNSANVTLRDAILFQALKGVIKKLNIATEREKMFLKHAPVANKLFSYFENAKQDPVSIFLSNNHCVENVAL